MRLILKRSYFSDATLGILYIEGLNDPVFHTIERPWLENENNISCIPEGEYRVKNYSSAKYKDVWQLCDVSERTYILIHKGNWAHDVKGCIAIGMSSGYLKYEQQFLKAVMASADAMDKLKEVTNYPDGFSLLIRS